MIKKILHILIYKSSHRSIIYKSLKILNNSDWLNKWCCTHPMDHYKNEAAL